MLDPEGSESTGKGGKSRDLVRLSVCRPQGVAIGIEVDGKPAVAVGQVIGHDHLTTLIDTFHVDAIRHQQSATAVPRWQQSNVSMSPPLGPYL